MPFLTLHELSLQFDIPVRVLRYRLRQLLQAGKLAEGEDYRRDNFVDGTHFAWKINPSYVMHEIV
jgi:predicted transcriptional regulator